MAKLTPFGKYLKDNDLDRLDVGRTLRVSKQYVSMLSLGTATPGLSLAGEIEKWSKGAVVMQSWLPWCL